MGFVGVVFGELFYVEGIFLCDVVVVEEVEEVVFGCWVVFGFEDDWDVVFFEVGYGFVDVVIGLDYEGDMGDLVFGYVD